MVFLLRTYGIGPEEKGEFTGTAPFDDAGNTYYTDYLLVAKERGIVNSVGENLFAPEREMFVMLYNAFEALDETAGSATGKRLADFEDAAETASWAEAALDALVERGLVGGWKVFPAGGAARARRRSGLRGAACRRGRRRTEALRGYPARGENKEARPGGRA